MWLILQQPKPDDYVLATGECRSVREFIELAFAQVGAPFRGREAAEDEVGVDGNGRVLVKVDPRYFRPTEVDLLLGDASKAQRELGWKAETTFTELVAEMVQSDLELLRVNGNALATLKLLGNICRAFSVETPLATLSGGRLRIRRVGVRETWAALA